MGQFRALMYKNYKLQSKNAFSTLFQILLPLVCIVIILSLQQLAKNLANKNEPVTPGGLPFNSFTILNNYLSGDLVEKYLGIHSCLRMNKYGFSDMSDTKGQSFVTENLLFDNKQHMRNVECTVDNKTYTSPNFDKLDIKDYQDINQSMADEMKIVYDSSLADNDKHIQPSDGYYLFHEANKNKIKVTLVSNNMNNQLYHRANGQTQLWFGDIPVN